MTSNEPLSEPSGAGTQVFAGMADASLPLRRPSSKIKVPYAALQYLVAFVDASLIILASVVGGGLYQIVANGDFANADQLLGAGIIAALLYVLIGQSGGFYDLRVAFSKGRRDAGRIFAQWSLVTLLLTLLAFLM